MSASSPAAIRNISDLLFIRISQLLRILRAKKKYISEYAAR